MQKLTHIDPKPTWQLLKLTKYFLLVVASLLVYFMPALHQFWQQLDYTTYELLNRSLELSKAWQFFWGYLNHPNENWLNIVAMGTINIMAILALDKNRRPRAIAQVMYFWLFFQIVLLFTQKALIGGLHIQRSSPSVIHYPWVILSETLNISNIKVYSHCSFPAGHALVLIYWAKFTWLYCNAKYSRLVSFVLILLLLPRLFSGAHWLSDIVFTYFYGLLWFNIATGTPLYQSAISFIENKIRPRINYEKCIY